LNHRGNSPDRCKKRSDLKARDHCGGCNKERDSDQEAGQCCTGTAWPKPEGGNPKQKTCGIRVSFHVGPRIERGNFERTKNPKVVQGKVLRQDSLRKGGKGGGLVRERNWCCKELQKGSSLGTWNRSTRACLGVKKSGGETSYVSPGWCTKLITGTIQEDKVGSGVSRKEREKK